MLDSFLKPGGIPALVRLLKESSCPLTLQLTATVVIGVLTCWDGVNQDWTVELAQKFYNAGEPGLACMPTRTRQTGDICCEVLRIAQSNGGFLNTYLSANTVDMGMKRNYWPMFCKQAGGDDRLCYTGLLTVPGSQLGAVKPGGIC